MRIIPITTSRTVVRIADGREGEKKLPDGSGWQKKLPSRADGEFFPRCTAPRTFDQAIQACQAAWKIILWEEERKQSLRRVLQSRSSMPDSIAILIGPEGGWRERSFSGQTAWLDFRFPWPQNSKNRDSWNGSTGCHHVSNGGIGMKSAPGKRVAFYTLGCKTNQYDTEAMQEQFVKMAIRL
jgi:hypothetical protein